MDQHVFEETLLDSGFFKNHRLLRHNTQWVP